MKTPQMKTNDSLSCTLTNCEWSFQRISSGFYFDCNSPAQPLNSIRKSAFLEAHHNNFHPNKAEWNKKMHVLYIVYCALV